MMDVARFIDHAHFAGMSIDGCCLTYGNSIWTHVMTQEIKSAVMQDGGEPLEVDEAHVPDVGRNKTGTDGVTPPSTVATRMCFGASPAQVWAGLVLYEEIERPPLHLRLLLPVPIRVEDRVSEVGDEAKCLYEGGHLLKRITRIQRGHLYEFEVAEQQLSVGGGMRLLGGGYALRELPDGETEVTVETRYVSTKWPRWLWAPLERMVCRWFHRYLLRSMRRKVESQ